MRNFIASYLGELNEFILVLRPKQLGLNVSPNAHDLIKWFESAILHNILDQQNINDNNGVEISKPIIFLRNQLRANQQEKAVVSFGTFQQILH